MIKRRTLLQSLTGAATLGAMGASLPFNNLVRAAGKPVVALLPGVVDPFYFTMKRGADQAAEEEGIELLFQIPKAWNVTDQVPILKAIIAKKPDVLLISPVDKDQLIQPLKEAADAGIKVITVDTYIGEGKYQTGSGKADFPLSYVASDNTEGGRIAARALAKAIGEKGSVYCENNKPGISSTDQRMVGFEEEIAKFPNIKVLKTQYNEDDANKAAAHVAAVLAREPDLAGIVVFDAVPGIDASLKSGLVDVAIAQKPSEMGYVGVKFASDLIKGKTIPTWQGTGFVVMDKSNIDQEDVHKYIYSN